MVRAHDSNHKSCCHFYGATPKPAVIRKAFLACDLRENRSAEIADDLA